MHLDHLWLSDFRNYASAALDPAPAGLTVIIGSNGEGKTNLLEAIGYLASLRSFRGAPAEALVRVGAPLAVVRAEAHRERRELLIEAEINPAGRDRVQVNRQPLRRARDLLGALSVTVFAPDDLALVKAGPQGRRDYLDDLIVAVQPRHDAVRSDFERVLRQRNSLLKQAVGNPRPPAAIAATLDVWDQKLAASGEELVVAREAMVRDLSTHVSTGYDRVAERSADVRICYHRSWSGSLAEAVALARPHDLRRGMSTVGPHRDDLVASIGLLASRTHASQGEQRSLALALRLAGHRVVADATATMPVLLLDDVFSELDAERSEALLASLPAGQAILTSAGSLPDTAQPELVVRVKDGKLLA